MLHELLGGFVAQTADGAGGLFQFLPLVLVFVIMYVVLIRPQQKTAKEHSSLLASLKKGDEVVTNGGVIGTIYAVTEKVLTLEVANGVRIRVLKSAVQARQGGEPEAAPDKDAAAEKKEGK